MKKLLICAAVCVTLLVIVWQFAPIPIPMDEPTRSQCDRMTTNALFLTVLQSTETTNLAYVDSWPEFLEKVSESYYPLQALETREDAQKIISAYIEETDKNEDMILQHLKAECLLEHIEAKHPVSN